MALNRQSQKDIQDTATYIEDTLKSVSANLGEVFKNAVESAFDGVDATVMTVATKDFTRAMAAAAKTSEDLVKNHYRISQGLTTSKNLEKQLQTIAERKLELERRYAYTKQLAEDIGKKMTKQQQQAFKDAQAALDLQEQILEADRQDLVIIEKKLGLTGKLIQSLGKVPGIGKFIKADEIDQEMRKAAAKGAGRLQTMGVAGKMIGKQLFDGLLDPLALITAIWNGFMKVDEAATDFTRITGQSTSAISSMNSNLASTVDILQVASDLSKELGVAGNNFISPQQLAAVAETKNLLGLSAEQATKLAIQTKMSGQNVDTFKKNVMAGVKQSNLQNRTGVEYGVVIKDILDTSEDVTMSLGNNPKKLAAAATAARAFGLTLQQVDDIAGSLTNFEDSIGAELEAQLLTGKNINLSKARELALNNDLEGVANELAKNGASAAEFSQMNRIQQEGLAKALGMSREQLAKSVLAQEASKNLTDKQRAAVMGMSEAEYERVSVQERIQTSLDKIAQAFAPILEKFVIPIVEVLTKIMNLPLVPYILLAVVAVRSLGLSLMGVGKAFGSMFNVGKQALTGLAGLFKKGGFKEALGGIKDKLVGGFKQGASGDAVGDLKAKVAGKEGGKGFKDSMKNLADGLKEMGAQGVGKGILNLAMAGPALVLALPSIPFLLFMGKASLKELPANFKALAEGLNSMSDTFKGSLALGAFAVAGTLAIPSLIFLGGIAAIGAVAKTGLEMLAAGLKALGKGAGEILIGIGVLAAFNVAMIPFAYAMGLAAPYIEAFGTVITSAFTGLATLVGAVADGFVNLMEAVSMEKILPMMLLGPALFGIAAGLGALSFAGIAALPAIGGLVLLSKAAPALVSLGIGGNSKSAGEAKGKSEEGGMAALEAKFDTLIELVRQGTTINLDGSKIATSVNRNLPKVQTATA